MPDSIQGSYTVRRDVVARLMKEQGWTKRTLAAKSNVGYRSLGRLLEGAALRMSTISPIAKTLGVTPNCLIDHPEQSADRPSSENHQTLLLKFSFEIDVPYSSFHEKEHVPRLLEDIGKKIHQMGLLVIDSANPGSVRIVCLASDPSDVARFFEAFTKGEFDSMRIKNPQILSETYDDESEPHSQSERPRPSTSDDTSPDRQESSSFEGTRESSTSFDDTPSEPIGPVNATRYLAAGMAAGAVAGSMVPGVGTALGIVVGGVIGTLISLRQTEQRQKTKK